MRTAHFDTATAEPTVVAFSGADNTGKTTQIRILTRRAPQVHGGGALDDFDSRWQGAHRQGLAHWWFSDAPVQEVADVLASSYLARAGFARRQAGDGGVVLVDRGLLMLEASVVATLAVREGLQYDAAVDTALRLLEPYAGECKEVRGWMRELVLLHDEDPVAGAARALARETAFTPQYAAYQQILNLHVHRRHHQAPGALESVVTGDQPIMQVQGVVCGRLRAAGVDVPEPAVTRARVYALGGMSECGKSTAGAYLSARHDVDRLKIGYLLESAAARHQISQVYELEPMQIAELLVLELDRYLAAHHYQRQVSVESLHHFQQARALQVLLGDALTTVFLDTGLPQRRRRGVDGPTDVTDRDAVKRGRGADQIKTIADTVIDNSGPRIALHHRLDRLVRQQNWPSGTLRRVEPRTFNLPGHLSEFLSQLTMRLTTGHPGVELMAVTGSASRGGYIPGWSDLDLLVIADDTDPVREALAAEAHRLRGVKLGVTVVTYAECQAGALTSRLLHTLASIAAGTTPVLWYADGLLLPCPDPAVRRTAEQADANAAAMQIRRLLLRDRPDAHALYKQTALLAKLALHCEGRDHPADADALAALLDLIAREHPGPAPGPHDLDRARTSPTVAETLARHVVGWWLSTLGAPQ